MQYAIGHTHHVSRFTFHVLRTSEGGLSLIATLWILTILTVLATQFLYSIRLEQRAQANFTERTKFHYAAKAGFERSVAMMRGDETPFDALGEDWAQEIEEDIEDGTIVGNAIVYRVKITDEGSKVNLNTAEENVMRGLLSLIGYEETEEQLPLAEVIVEGRPYRTVRDLARVEGMTQEVLYGQPQPSNVRLVEDEAEGENVLGLIDLATIYSIDKNTDANGGQRVNINSADAQQITQIRRDDNNEPAFSQGEADSLIQQRSFNSIGDLLDAQAVSNQTFDNIRDRMTVEGNQGNQGGANNNQGNQDGADGNGENQDLVNINTADANRLQSLDGIDQGIADRIIDHRSNQGQFQNVDQLKDVKLVTSDEFKNIVDKITTLDDETVKGQININTASWEILQLLPGMDENKAQAIIDRRESQPEADQQIAAMAQSEVEGNPFMNIGQLLDIAEIDIDTFRQIAGLVTYRSHSFLIESVGVEPQGKTIASCVGAIDRSGEQITIQYWKQD